MRTISESKDLSTITTTMLFGKLIEFEIEMNRLNKQENQKKKMKSITLKSSAHKGVKFDEEIIKISDNENMNIIVRKFGKFLGKKGK